MLIYRWRRLFLVTFSHVVHALDCVGNVLCNLVQNFTLLVDTLSLNLQCFQSKIPFCCFGANCMLLQVLNR